MNKKTLTFLCIAGFGGYLIFKTAEKGELGGNPPPAYFIADTVEVMVSIGDLAYPAAYATVLEREWRQTTDEWEEQWWYFVSSDAGDTQVWLPESSLRPA